MFLNYEFMINTSLKARKFCPSLTWQVFKTNFEFCGISILRFRLNTTFRCILISWFDQNTMLAIEFSVREFPIFQNFEKSMEPKCQLKYIFIFFYTPQTRKSIKNTRKVSFWFKGIVIFINWIYKSQDLTIFLQCVKNLCIVKL